MASTLAGVVTMEVEWPIVLFFPDDSAESFHSSEDLETSGEQIVVEGHTVAFDRAFRRLILEQAGERYMANVASDQLEEDSFVHHALSVLYKLQRHLRGKNRARLQIPNVERLSPRELFDALVLRLG
ncbi:hypothetical protein [Agromyces badenianii]|uniref:hypothetical protein n=1 Tax=Agromyces badenianii TaxID=2080742 RepID=UPI000D59FC24|nr:hypothetical protein [Agromyces badenianii]PWC03034.1 hypothetical protein DCE94_12150 [Agromyces badenianii]